MSFRVLIQNPDIAKPHVLTVLLEFKPFGTRPDFDTAVGVFDRHIVVDLQTIPPHGRTGWLDGLVAVPSSGLENKVEGMPLAVWPPSVDVGHAFHAEGTDAVGANFPVVRILNIL